MMHGKYIGLTEALKGQGALIRDDPSDKNWVLAQFDNRNLPPPFEYMAFNWHSFPATCFEIDATEEGE